MALPIKSNMAEDGLFIVQAGIILSDIFYIMQSGNRLWLADSTEPYNALEFPRTGVLWVQKIISVLFLCG